MKKRVMKKMVKKYLANLTYDQNIPGGHVRVLARLIRRGYYNKIWDMWSQNYENAVVNRIYIAKIFWDTTWTQN